MSCWTIYFSLFVYDTEKHNGLYHDKIIVLFPKHDYRIFRWRAAVACLTLNKKTGRCQDWCQLTDQPWRRECKVQQYTDGYTILLTMRWTETVGKFTSLPRHLYVFILLVYFSYERWLQMCFSIGRNLKIFCVKIAKRKVFKGELTKIQDSVLYNCCCIIFEINSIMDFPSPDALKFIKVIISKYLI